MSRVQHVVLVLSGKGGVGKSTVTTELALALRHAGKRVSQRERARETGRAAPAKRKPNPHLPSFPQVGILDVDLCGPSIPRMLNIKQTDVHQCDSGWVPVYADAQQTLALMSIGFLLEDPDEAVVWRGPKKNGTSSSSSSSYAVPPV